MFTIDKANYVFAIPYFAIVVAYIAFVMAYIVFVIPMFVLPLPYFEKMFSCIYNKSFLLQLYNKWEKNSSVVL
jgi:hypothetical protein